MPSKTFLNLDEDKKKNILNAASSIFIEKTFEKAKVVDICKKANIPRVTFYSYFESLEDIYNYIYEYYSSEFCSLENIKNPNVDVNFFNDAINYFIKIIDSDIGLKKVYEKIDSLDFNDKALSHYIVSVSFQYKTGAITKEDFLKSINDAINNIQ